MLNVHCLQLLCTYFIQTHEHLFRVHSFISTVRLIKWVIFLSFFIRPVCSLIIQHLLHSLVPLESWCAHRIYCHFQHYHYDYRWIEIFVSGCRDLFKFACFCSCSSNLNASLFSVGSDWLHLDILKNFCTFINIVSVDEIWQCATRPPSLRFCLFILLFLFSIAMAQSILKVKNWVETFENQSQLESWNSLYKNGVTL